MNKSLLIILLALNSITFAQINSCANIGFELNNFTEWDLYRGTVTNTTYEINNIVVDSSGVQHQILSAGFDPIVPMIQKTSPFGGLYSASLGDIAIAGYNAAIIKKTFFVDSLTPNFIYHHAIILENDGHTSNESPFFTAQIFDSSMNIVYSYQINSATISSSGDPDFLAYNNVFYSDWKSIVVDLTAYAGEILTVEFTSGDCFQGGHYGYAYIDANCLSSTTCATYSFNFTSALPIKCNNSSLISTQVNNGTPPYIYQWSTGESTSEISPSSPGVYSLTVSDSLGCSMTKSVLINSYNYPSGYDLNLNLSSSSYRPGQSSYIFLNAFNDGCLETSGQLKLILDNMVTYNNAIPAPNFINGDTLTWNIASLKVDSLHFMPIVNVQTNTTAALGDTLCFIASISPTIGDMNNSNNQKQYCSIVVNSYDPNYKAVYPKGECFENYVIENQELTYTVHFQNTGTASAIDIFIIDTISSNLKINSSRIVGKSHENLITEVINGNALKFIFNNINLPDSTTNEVESHGYVMFTIQPQSNIPNPSRIENRVAIYFDFNAPIITNTVFNTYTNTIPHTETILNETSISNFELNGIIYDSTGTYYQHLLTADGCDSIIVLNLTISTTVGIQKPNNEDGEIMIYPNPIKNELEISIPVSFINYHVEVINSSGRLIFKNSNISKIDFASFAQGIYFVKIWNDKQIVVRKVIKE